MDLGNFIAIAMVFGQFVSGKQISMEVLIAGVAIAIICYVISYVLSS